ncbi:unnamed protein product [Mytilus edulis]|uniref:Uncharacterized protein n=1 Tax=Mytilus edulis TaxID=6550 RepID=A0A8S3RXT4_MYTED|nr:unnamed protein product [Mytilus edulis]
MNRDVAIVISVFTTLAAQYVVLPLIQYCIMKMIYGIKKSSVDQRLGRTYDELHTIRDRTKTNSIETSTVPERTPIEKEEKEHFYEVSYARVTSFQCYICLFVYIPTLIYTVIYRTNLEGKGQHLSVILMTCLSTGIVLCIIWTQAESLLSWEMQYLENIYNKESCVKYLNELRQSKPIIKMTVVCFHYEEETVMRSSRPDTTTHTREVRVIDYTESENFIFDTWVDKSSDPTSLNINRNKLTRVRIPAEISFGNEFTKTQFNKQKEDFIYRVFFQGNWKEFEFILQEIVNGHESRIFSGWESANKMWWMTKDWGADCGSDHHLLLGKIKLELRKVVRPQNNRKAYNIHRLEDNQIRLKFNISIRNQYQTLQNISENNDNIGPDLNEHWNKVKTMFSDTAANVLGLRDRTRKRWISDSTWNVIEKRRFSKSKCNQTRSERLKVKQLQIEYSELNREIKKIAKEENLQYIEGLANEAEEACKHGELSTVYKITKQLCGKSNNNDTPVFSKNREVLTSEAQKLERWAEHFREVLNREPPEKPAQFDNTEAKMEIDISEEKTELGEIKKALCRLKNGKLAGVEKDKDDITKIALRWTLAEGKRKRGRPKETWRRTIESKLRIIGMTWGEAERKAQYRQQWRALHNTTAITDNQHKTTAITDNQHKPTAIIDNQLKTTPITDNHDNTTAITDNQHNTAAITDNQHNTAAITDNQHNTAAITYNQHNTAAITYNQHNTAAITDNQHNTTAITDNNHNTAAITYNQHNTAAITYNQHNTAAITDNQHNTTAITDNQHNTAAITDNQHDTSAITYNQHNTAAITYNQHDTTAITYNQHDTAESSSAPFDTTVFDNDRHNMTESIAQSVTEKTDPLAKEDNIVTEKTDPLAKEDNIVTEETDPLAKEDNIVTEETDPLAKEDNLYVEVSYVRITSLQCYICLFIYIPV